MKVFKILEHQSIQEKYKYSVHNVLVEIHELYAEDEKNWESILEIVFLDNKYYNGALEEEEYGSVLITFIESFKQINFADNKVYTAFETISIGANNIYNTTSCRDYIEFAEVICYLLCNQDLL